MLKVSQNESFTFEGSYIYIFAGHEGGRICIELLDIYSPPGAQYITFPGISDEFEGYSTYFHDTGIDTHTYSRHGDRR